MWGNNLAAPPITTDLWTEIRDRLRVSTINAILGGTNRVYVEGEQSAEGEDVETAPWGRIVVMQRGGGEPTAFEPGLPTTLLFQLRMDVNARPVAGYLPKTRLEIGLREAFKLIQGWGGPLTSTRITIGGEIHSDSGRSDMLDDIERSGTYYMTQFYRVDVTEVLNAA